MWAVVLGLGWCGRLGSTGGAMDVDWGNAAAGLSAGITAIREYLAGKATAEALRERLGVVAERLALAQDQMRYQGEMSAGKEARIAELTAELVKAHAENRKLEAQVSLLHQQAQPDPFVERMGLVFKRTADGGWSENAFCPSCREVLVVAFGHLACSDKRCGWAKLNGAHLVGAGLAELKG